MHFSDHTSQIRTQVFITELRPSGFLQIGQQKFEHHFSIETPLKMHSLWECMSMMNGRQRWPPKIWTSFENQKVSLKLKYATQKETGAEIVFEGLSIRMYINDKFINLMRVGSDDYCEHISVVVKFDLNHQFFPLIFHSYLQYSTIFFRKWSMLNGKNLTIMCFLLIKCGIKSVIQIHGDLRNIRYFFKILGLYKFSLVTTFIHMT